MGLTELEQRLVKAATGGHELACGGGEIRADVVRSLLLGQWADALDPHGIQVADARITGTLNLDGMETTTQVRFIRCRFDEPVLASRAMLRRLELDGCELPSLRADGLTTELDLSIRDCTIAHDDADGPVRLRGTVIGGNLLCDGATLTNGSGPALNAKGLRHATLEYAPQPYRQLAAYHRSLGHEPEARRTLMLQQDDALGRGAIRGALPRLGHWLFGLLLGYGYRTWRALASLVVVVVLACGIGLAAGHTPTRGTPAAAHPDGTACSTVEQVGVGLDRGLPVIATGMSDRCELGSTTAAGQVYTAAGWVLQVAAWALATLVVAGYTGLIRKPE